MLSNSQANRVNVGCGSTPTPGWINLDNSPTVRLADFPCVGTLLSTVPLLRQRTRFIQVARANHVQWASATELPLADESMTVVYSSHMLEHLDRAHAERFLREAKRVLRPKGVLRIVVPDLQKLVQQYLQSGDADLFVGSTLLPLPPSSSLLDRLKLSTLGHRGHAWLYDAASLSRLLESVGFVDVQPLPAGETRIHDPAPLDLYERAGESLFVEASKAQ